jgi:hypothetical protein
MPPQHQRDYLLRELRHLARSNLMRGSLSVVGRTCGRPTCTCITEGKRHPARYLSTKKEGRTRLVYVSPGQEAEVEAALRRCRRLLALLDKLTEVNIELIKQTRPPRRRRGAAKP